MREHPANRNPTKTQQSSRETPREHHPSPARRRRLPLLLAATALTLALAACGDDDDASEPAGSVAPAAAEQSATPAANLPDTITIGYQNVPNGDLVVKHERLLEQAFGDSVTVEWKLFDSGGSVNEAVVAGGVDIGLVGSSPASRGISSGDRVPGAVDPRRDRQGRGARGARRQDRHDRRPEGQDDRHTVRVDARTTACWPRSRTPGSPRPTSTIIDAEPDAIYAAWQQGDIDGAYVWNPNLAKLVDEGGTVLVDQRGAGGEGQDHVRPRRRDQRVRRAVPRGGPDLGRPAERSGRSRSTSDPDAAAEAVAAELNITPEEAKRQARRPDLPRRRRAGRRPTTSVAGWPRTCSPPPSSTRSSARSTACNRSRTTNRQC